MRILSVDLVKLSLLKSNPPQLLIEANGTVGTPGWKDLQLVSLEEKLSDDGILDLEFTGTPPGGIVPQVTRPVSADILITDEVEKIIGVMVHSRTNSVLELLGGKQGGEVQRPDLTTLVFGEEKAPFGEGGATTLALGEEKSPLGEKFPIGEKTERFGEEKLPFGEKSPFFGEEKFPGGEKTGAGIETEAVGETLFAGETGFTGESSPVSIETDVGIETDTGPVGEDFQDVFRDRIRTPFNRR